MLMPQRSSEWPRMITCHQKLYKSPLSDEQIIDTVQKQFKSCLLHEKIKPGMSVALAAGSRGIASYALVIKTLVNTLKELGANPFIFPAMGSHGGATPEGQKGVLAGYGITDESMGCPVKSSLDVVELGRIPAGLPVYLDKFASQADAIIITNRIKEHTNFHGDLESGLCKMLAIGTGKHAQAIAIHSYGALGLREYMPQIAKTVIEKAPIMAGFALIEDASHKLSKIIGIPGKEIPETERELLKEVKKVKPRLPVDKLDLLIVEQLGKEISGTGIDTTVVGRAKMLDMYCFPSPEIRTIVALDLTETTHGNAIGVGLAELIPKKLAEKIDHRVTALNSITGLCPGLGAVPITLENDREVIRTALDYFCAHVPFQDISIIQIKDTLSLETIQISESLYNQLKDRSDLTFEDNLNEMQFTDEGDLVKSNCEMLVPNY